MLAGAVVFGLGASFLKARAAAGEDPRKSRPQPGDYFVFLKGPRKDEIIAPKDLPLGGPQVMAYPMDSESKIIRRGSRLNQVALVRLDPSLLSEKTRALSVEGVVAFERRVVRGALKNGTMVFEVGVTPEKAGTYPINGVFRIGFHDGEQLNIISVPLMATVTGTP